MGQTGTQLGTSIGDVIRWLTLIAMAVIILDILGMTFALVSGHDSVFGLLGLIDLDKERGVGMLFQVLLLLGNAALFYVVSRASRQGRSPAGPWLLLCFIFLFLSMDEFAFIHERLMPVMHAIVGDEGVFRFAWIVPYGIAVLILAVWVAPQILRLPGEPRFFMIAAAIAYLSGALVLEAVGGWRLDAIGGESARPELIYELLTTVEESLEIAGLILLMRALLGIVRDAYPQIAVTLADGR